MTRHRRPPRGRSAAAPPAAGRPRKGTLVGFGPAHVTVHAAAVARILVCAVLLLLAVHILLQTIHYAATPLPWHLRQIFDLDEEDSFPTWYSAVALLFASLLIAVVALRARRRTDRWARHWIGLGVGFLVLSIDEVAGLHETLNSVTDFSWTIPAAVGALVVLAVYLPFLRGLPARLRSRFLLAGGAFLLGALLVEYATDPFADQDRLNTLAYNLSTVPEEALEMFGVVLLIYALIDYIGDGRPVTVGIDAVQDAETNAAA